MNDKNNSIAFICAGFTVLLWSSSFPGVKYALAWYSPGALMLLRFFVASITLAFAAYVKKASIPAKEDVPYVLSGGAIGIFAYMLLFNIGSDMVKSGISSFVIATAPIFTLLLSSGLLKERLRLQTIAGVVLSAFGLTLIAYSQVKEFSLNYGLLLLLLASFCTSCYNIIQRKISFKYDAIQRTSYTVIFATVPMLLFAGELARDLPKAPPLATAVVVYLGVFPAALAYLSWNYAIGKAGTVSSVSNFLYLTPFFATTLAYFFLGEELSPLALAGGFTIIAGMVLANYAGRMKAAPQSN